MAGPSKNTKSLQQTGNQGSGQASTPTGLQANKQVGKKAGFFFRPPVHLVLIVLLGLLVYSNTFQSPFQWDELGHIVGNPVVKDLGYFTDISRAEGLPAYDGLKSRYIGYLTFALNYKLHGFNVSGYHVVNLAIHLINAILVYFLVLLTFRTPYFGRGNPLWLPSFGQAQGPAPTNGGGRYSHFFALAVALLFVVHPVQTEAVTYVFQRFASLVSMFYMLSLVLYIKGRFGEMGNGQEVQTERQRDSEDTPLNPPLPRGEVKGGVSPSPLTSRPSPPASSLSLAYRLSPIAYYVLSLLFAVLAMKTKENAFTLPVVIALYEFLFFSGPVKTRLLRLAPFLLTMLIVPLTIMGSGSTAGEIISQVKDPVSMGYITPAPQDYLFTQFRVIVTYLRLLFLPVNQTLLYDYPLYQSFFAPPVLFSFLFLAFLFCTAVYLVYRSRQGARGKGQEVQTERQRDSEDTPLNPPSGDHNSPFPPLNLRGGAEGGGVTLRGERKGGAIHHSLFTIHYSRLLGFGILWFFITLAVESSIIPIPMVIDEYRVYLPSVGFFLALVSGVVLLLQQSSRFTIHGSRFAKIAAALFSVIIIALAVATYARNNIWKDRVSLWEDIVRKSPGLGMGYDNLGMVYEELGRKDEAIEQYRKAMRLAPDTPTPHINLGYTLEAMGRLDEAITEYQAALRLDPRNWQARLNLGSAYGKKGLADKAIEELQTTLKAAPNPAPVLINLGNAYRQKGEVDKAIEQYLAALRLDPEYAEAHYNLGDVYEEKKELDKAIKYYLAAVRSKPTHIRAHYNLGRVYVKARQLDEAIKQVETVVRLSPGNSVYHNTLGVLYGQKGSYDKAMEQFETALQLAPDNASYRQNLERAKGLKSKQ